MSKNQELAFPNPLPENEGEVIHRGMTLRDYFAIEIFKTRDLLDYPSIEIAMKASYEMADKMILLRDK